MRLARVHKSEAFTRVELVVVLFVLAVVFALIAENPSAHDRSMRAESQRIACLNNLKGLGDAYRVWANDHNGRYPASVSVKQGGWRDVLSNPEQGPVCWTNYAIMSNELGKPLYEYAHFPKSLICPSDEREPAGAFSNFVSNLQLSYFVGVSADDTYPQTLLGGDRNLGEGTKPGRDYGFSPDDGTGNDVAIQTNSQTGPVCWSSKMHSLNSDGAGNIMLGDGSVDQTTSERFRASFQPNFDPTTNWPAGHVPSLPSIRVLFP